MAPQPVLVVNDSGGGEVLGLFALPALYPPGIVVYRVWTLLGDLQVHPLFQWAGAGAVLSAFGLAAWLFYRYAPMWIAIIATMIYMAVTYGAAAQWAHLDKIWTGGIVIAITAIGYFVGKALWVDQQPA